MRTFSLRFAEFDLEFRVDAQASAESTEALRPPGSCDYAFAAGEIWISRPEDSTVLIDQFSTGNILETLRELDKRLIYKTHVSGINKYIRAGAWCEWIINYWGRLERDAITAEDEEIYDTLRSALLIEGDSGRLAIYRMEDAVILEACTIESGAAAFSVLSRATAIELRAAVSALIWQISDFVRLGSEQ